MNERITQSQLKALIVQAFSCLSSRLSLGATDFRSTRHFGLAAPHIVYTSANYRQALAVDQDDAFASRVHLSWSIIQDAVRGSFSKSGFSEKFYVKYVERLGMRVAIYAFSLEGFITPIDGFEDEVSRARVVVTSV